MRRGRIKYLCKDCNKWFQINRGKRKPEESLLIAHLSGISFRSLGAIYNIAPSTAYRRSVSALKQLPHCADITRKYCSKFCGILLVDGKFLKVKGYDRKIPVIYGIDYLSHDIPSYILAPSENYQVCRKFFSSLRLLNYPLHAIVSDDNANIYQAGVSVYPKAHTQLCHNHYKENIRTALSVRNDPTYVPFMKQIEELFVVRRSVSEFQHMAQKIMFHHRNDPRCVSVLIDIAKRLPQLTAYTHQKHIPTTNNLIESFNSHLEGRLKTIKGFESFAHANYWLNGYFLRRRLKPFTDCSGQFTRLNGICSLRETMDNPKEITNLLKFFR